MEDMNAFVRIIVLQGTLGKDRGHDKGLIVRWKSEQSEH